jgi:uncharacterized membrane protein YkvA (DUF1232 family)
VTWWQLVAVGLVLVVASWVVLVLLARALPPGVMREVAAFLPNCGRLVWQLRKDPSVPRRAKVALLVAGLWVLSPIDLVPEFLPVVGPLDDAVVVALALRYAARQVPRHVIHQAWDGDPAVLDRLLGRPAEATP